MLFAGSRAVNLKGHSVITSINSISEVWAVVYGHYETHKTQYGEIIVAAAKQKQVDENTP